MKTQFILLIVAAVLLIAMLVWTRTREPFDNPPDISTLQAQRQQLQFEGERSQNDFGAIQAQPLDPKAIEAALQQTVPTGTSKTPAYSSLLGLVGLGGRIPGAATGVEQTGAVQSKIAFCESQPVNCAALNGGSSMAECGFCHRGGTNSKGKPHRGGMYISSDDQIRANERAGQGGRARYHPTVGKCAPEDFTLTPENCQVRESQLKCLQAGGPTADNECAQCFGGGLLYVGQKPRKFNAVLWISHPGAHSHNGSGLTIQMGSGTPINVPYSSRQLLDPQQIQLTNIAEGDTVTLTLYGAPALWCAWLSSPDGLRTVSLDIGVQSVQPTNAFAVAGDKRSGPVSTATAAHDADIWSTFQAQVPNTVLWFQRRETVPGAVTSAWYGTTLPTAPAAQGNDVTEFVKQAAGVGSGVAVGEHNIVSNLANVFMEPGSGGPSHLWVQQDSGQTQILDANGPGLDPALINNVVQFTVQIPATLVAPTFTDDLALCPSGPMVFTASGAGLMGSHSCFKADGSFNPTQFCLRELWSGAGGTSAGQGFPNTDAKAAALVVADPTTKAPSMDATVAALNNLGSIALYGVDSKGAQASFEQYQSAALFMLGTTVTSPCDTSTGTHSAMCLDYLWRTSTSTSTTPYASNLPYSACNANGQAAPLNADGTPNVANVAAANALGPISAIRAWYANLFAQSQDPSDFNAQAAAMRACFNVDLVPPPTPPSACPVGPVSFIGSTLTLKNALTDTFLTLSGIQTGVDASDADGTAAGSQWRVTDASQGWIGLQSVKGGGFLCVCEGCGPNGLTTVDTHQNTTSGVWNSASWSVEPLDGGGFAFKNVLTGTYLAVCEGCVNPNTTSGYAVDVHESASNGTWTHWIPTVLPG